MDALRPDGAPRRRAGRSRLDRPHLDRGTIVQGALEILDEGGVESLSMRTLGRHLGYEAMALYRHVGGREEILEAVVDHLLGDLDLPDPVGDREEYLRGFARAVRTLAEEHPQAFPLVATTHPAAPWLCPPLRSLALVDRFFEDLRQLGWDRESSVEVYQAFASFLLGFLLLETARAGTGTAPPDVPLDEGGEQGPTGPDRELDVAAYPRLVELRPLLEQDRCEEEFHAGLETLLERLRRRFPDQPGA
ncbi:TetR/AcrR family transcriptional regulator [Ornithinimicrobium sp. W1679]|uniref:TetR/AcrR family transcriptional regulator n=1 Tax=Ornithinimicrobium sp. W1679 TaxID=3418770 RepID=UPI003CF2C1E2